MIYIRMIIECCGVLRKGNVFMKMTFLVKVGFEVFFLMKLSFLMNDLVVSINKMYSGINACRVGNLRL